MSKLKFVKSKKGVFLAVNGETAYKIEDMSVVYLHTLNLLDSKPEYVEVDIFHTVVEAIAHAEGMVK